MNISTIPKIISYEEKTWYLSINWGEYCNEWSISYKRYFEYSEPEKELAMYGTDFPKLVKDFNQKLKDKGVKVITP